MAKSITFSVYRIFCTSSSLSYVGLTRSLEKRKRTHLNQLRNGSHKNLLLQEAFNLHGEHCFRLQVLESGVPASKIASREKHWIAHFSGFKDGYNLTRGGEVNLTGSIPLSDLSDDYKRERQPAAQRGYIEREVENGLDDWSPYYQPDLSAEGLTGYQKRMADKINRLLKLK